MQGGDTGTAGGGAAVGRVQEVPGVQFGSHVPQPDGAALAPGHRKLARILAPAHQRPRPWADK